ncbi:LuxR C-terminal-related transcriptional regulator [uncultured Treponema sp.]|uniref:LuxR C-terminal-related transcriptional regulator n=1 Tax=uncultured Treponema sp. TaxID=162155 RepID=UPI00345D5885
MSQTFEDFEDFANEGKLPDIIISELNFYGEGTGFDFVKKLHELYPQQKIIVYSMFFAPGIVENAIQYGANGYISKNASSDELLLCMEKVLQGEQYIENEFVPILEKFNSFTDALTKREKEMMNLILERHTNEEIAKILGIKKSAVENYVSRIYEKTDVKDRLELIERFG